MRTAIRATAAVILVLVGASFAAANELKHVDRTIAKEPAYKGKPKYGLLVFDRDGKERAWFVHDGDTLYVDRKGNGDLTDPKNKIASTPTPGLADGDTYQFEVGDVSIAGRTHKGLRLGFYSLKTYPQDAAIKAILAKDPDAMVATLMIDVQLPHLKGGGIDSRVNFRAGALRPPDVLRLAGKREDAPVIHFGGQLHITFDDDEKFRVGRSTDLAAVVGCPGIGTGTFAMIAYDDTIPDRVHPVVEVTFPAKPGAGPKKQTFELKQRC